MQSKSVAEHSAEGETMMAVLTELDVLQPQPQVSLSGGGGGGGGGSRGERELEKEREQGRGWRDNIAYTAL